MRINLVLKHALAQRRTARNLYAGMFHQFISYGFVVLTIATTVVALDAVDAIAAARRFFKGHRRVAFDHEAAMTASGFRLAPGKRNVDLESLVRIRLTGD